MTDIPANRGMVNRLTDVLTGEEIANISGALSSLSRAMHMISVDSGFWDGELLDGVDRNDAEAIALMHSELSEALEALRKPGPDKHCPEFNALDVEFADLLIRLFDFCGGRHIDIAGSLLAKAEFNCTRPYKHQKKF